MTGLGTQLAIGALRRLPLHALSRGAGRLACLPIPTPLRAPALRLFGAAVGVNFGEVRDPLESFPTLQAFFTRQLADGARPIDPDPDAFVAPCDGAWGAAGRIHSHQLLQVKGRPYSLGQLLGSEEEARAYEGGTFATLYLAPRDYHRFHAPCDARVSRARYLPGNLWPVNPIGVAGVDGLFAENERICATFDHGKSMQLAIVAVGATMVGKIHVTFDDITTQTGGARQERAYAPHDARTHLQKGDEWGRFEFGSTLVVVASPGSVDLEVQPPGSTVRLGQRIGTLADSL